MSNEKKWEGFTDKQIAQEILIDALDFALTEEHHSIDTDLGKLKDQDSTSKMKRVKKILAGMSHKIFLAYGHTNDLDMSGHPILEKFGEFDIGQKPMTITKMVTEKWKPKKGSLMQIDESALKPKTQASQAARYGVLGVQLGKPLYDALTEYCQKKGIVKTKLIRALVEAYLKDNK